MDKLLSTLTFSFGSLTSYMLVVSIIKKRFIHYLESTSLQ